MIVWSVEQRSHAQQNTSDVWYMSDKLTFLALLGLFSSIWKEAEEEEEEAFDLGGAVPHILIMEVSCVDGGHLISLLDTTTRNIWNKVPAFRLPSALFAFENV